MIHLFVLAALLQAPSVDDTVDAFLKGDAAARAELVKLGIYAIRPLQKVRDKAADKVDALLFELKKAAAHPRDTALIGALEKRVTVEETGDIPNDWAHSNIEIPFFRDRVLLERLKSRKVAIKIQDAPARAYFDQLFAQTGLDYGLFHNHVVLSLPERLWPPGPPAKPAKLTEAESARARALVEQLGDEKVATREAASSELLKLGISIVPVLEAQLGRKDPEVVSRCRVLIEILRQEPRGCFGPALALEQAENELLTTMKHATYPTVLLKDVAFEALCDILFGGKEIPFTLLDPGASSVEVSIYFHDAKAIDLISLVTQSLGLDFVIQDGKLVIDQRDKLVRSHSPKK